MVNSSQTAAYQKTFMDVAVYRAKDLSNIGDLILAKRAVVVGRVAWDLENVVYIQYNTACAIIYTPA